jgi:ATP-dependent helicase HepA
MPSLGFVREKRGCNGVGKLLAVGRGTSEVEYFDSPDGPKLRRVSVPTSSLFTVELPTQTRVFIFDPHAQAWRVGRADGLIDKRALGTDEDHYSVRLPNGGRPRVPISDLFVRSAAAIDNATDYLASRLNETPYFFDGRRRIVRHLARQRAAFGGLTALASSAIELIEHQVETTRLILKDPIQRYLLADEVGLGKTIEAGIVVRQHVLDAPALANVLIIVPDHLRQQWQSEMREKFFLPLDASVRVVGWQQLDKLDDADVTFMVVDEAHRLALHAFDKEGLGRYWYEAVRRLSARVPRMLLLSGTPVLHQEGAFLAMLHLLDPSGYPLDEVDQFRERVRGRQVVADAMLDLSDQASSFFVNDATARLQDAFPNDDKLCAHCQSVRALSDESPDSNERIQAIRALRVYLAENYRLHRRLLRTRRDDARVRGLLPERTGTLIIDHDDEARAEAADFLDTWRTSVPESQFESGHTEVTVISTLFAIWVSATLSHPAVLLRYIDARLALRDGDSPAGLPPHLCAALSVEWVFPREKEFLNTRRQLLSKASDVDARVVALANWFVGGNEVTKAVVFVDDPSIADQVAIALATRLSPCPVIRHAAGQKLPEPFILSDARAIIVCDSSAEEGLNLQRHGAALIHFDLPLAPMRVEQRIGRIDRLEARGRLRNVVFRSESTYEREWLSCLAKSIRVFDRSIAPLQYVLSDTVAHLHSHLLPEGAEAIAAAAVQLASGANSLDAELKRIRAQEAVDSLETDATSSRNFFERLTRADERMEHTSARNLEAWVVDRLLFKREEVEPRVVRYSYDVRRPTLIPLDEATERFRACIDTEFNVRNARLQLPLKPATYDRYTAENFGIPLLRVGHPFVDALNELMRLDDRGTSYVMWRCDPSFLPRESDPLLFLRFDFVIEADVACVFRHMPNVTGPETIRRRADAAFPVQHATVWLDRDLNRVVDERFVTLLEAPYVGRFDVNVTPERWSTFETLLSLWDWRDFCHRGARAAYTILRDDPALGRLRTDCGRQLRADVDTARDILKSRLSRLHGPARDAEERAAPTEWAIDEALIQGIEAPAIRVDAAGAVVLSRKPLESA